MERSATAIEIAGVRLDVSSEGRGSEVARSLGQLYPSRGARCGFAVRLVPVPTGSEQGLVDVVEGGRTEHIVPGQRLSGYVDVDARASSLSVPPEHNPVLSALRLVFAIVALRSGVLWLHSLGVLRQGQCYLFAGRSGSGKSTLGRTVAEGELLADESVAVWWRGGRPIACSTPFQSAGHVPPPHREGPLKAIHFLARGPHTEIRPMSPAEALTRIWPCIFSLERSLAAQQRGLALAGNLVQAVPVRELSFTLQPGVISEAIGDGNGEVFLAP